MIIVVLKLKRFLQHIWLEFSLCSRQNNRKIGPILAINNKEFTSNMLLKNLIKNIPKNKKNIIISGLSTNSKKLKKILFFLL